MAKKYFWLKLKEDFFNDKRIKKLRKVAGGDTYTIIYLKLALKTLNTNGVYEYESIEDNIFEELALELDEEVVDVEMTLGFLLKNGLLEKEDNQDVALPYVIENLGGESASASRVRKMREKNKLLGEVRVDEIRYGGNGLKVLERDNFKCSICGSSDNICIHHNNGMSNKMDDLVTLCRKCHSNVNHDSVTCNSDVTIGNVEKEKELEKELDIEKEIYLEYVKLTSVEYDKLIETYGLDITKDMIERLNDYIGSKGKKYKSHYHTIKTWIRKDKSNPTESDELQFDESGALIE